MRYCNGTQTTGSSDLAKLYDGVQDMATYDTCGDSCYLRSDTGGSPMPWHFVAVLLVMRFLLVFVRVAHWDKGQILALLLAVVNSWIITLAFFSTGLAPDKITVWSSIILVGDAGAVNQVIVLLLEKSGEHMPLFHHIIRPATAADDDNDNETPASFVNPRFPFLGRTCLTLSYPVTVRFTDKYLAARQSVRDTEMNAMNTRDGNPSADSARSTSKQRHPKVNRASLETAF
jgi:hypothetical protein